MNRRRNILHFPRADVDDLVRDVDFRPATPIEDGIPRFAAWYRSYCEA